MGKGVLPRKTFRRIHPVEYMTQPVYRHDSQGGNVDSVVDADGNRRSTDEKSEALQNLVVDKKCVGSPTADGAALFATDIVDRGGRNSRVSSPNPWGNEQFFRQHYSPSSGRGRKPRSKPRLGNGAPPGAVEVPPGTVQFNPASPVLSTPIPLPDRGRRELFSHHVEMLRN